MSRILILEFPGMSTCLPSLFDLSAYAVECAPSILMAVPAFGAHLHVVLGWCHLLTHYGTVLQLFSLCLVDTKVLFQRRRMFKVGVVSIGYSFIPQCPYLTQMSINFFTGSFGCSIAFVGLLVCGIGFDCCYPTTSLSLRV